MIEDLFVALAAEGFIVSFDNGGADALAAVGLAESLAADGFADIFAADGFKDIFAADGFAEGFADGLEDTFAAVDTIVEALPSISSEGLRYGICDNVESRFVS